VLKIKKVEKKVSAAASCHGMFFIIETQKRKLPGYLCMAIATLLSAMPVNLAASRF
jgi:hypothetical protein